MLRRQLSKSSSGDAVCASDVEAGASSLTESTRNTRTLSPLKDKRAETHFLTDCCRRFFCSKRDISDDDEEIIYTASPQVK